MDKEDIIKAWSKIRSTNNTIPDGVLDFMKDSAIKELEAHANSKMDMNRPDPKDIFGKNATPESIKKMYRGCSGCRSLFEYAQALDDYIDYLKSLAKTSNKQ